MSVRSLTTLTLAMIVTAISAGSALAKVQPNALFSDNAVLQRDVKVPVWGTARDGEKITVEFDHQKVSTTAADG